MSQRNRVKAVLTSSEYGLSLWEIRERIQARFQRIDSEAAISARIRDIRRSMEATGEGTINGARAQGKAWHRYSIQFFSKQIAQQSKLFAN